MVQDSEHKVSAGQPAAEVANFGLIRPPFVYLGSIDLGLLVHLFWPVQLVHASVGAPIGVIVVLVAAALFISAVRTFRKAGTPTRATAPQPPLFMQGHTASPEIRSISLSRSFRSDSLHGSTVSACC